jgi:hypothetical protein
VIGKLDRDSGRARDVPLTAVNRKALAAIIIAPTTSLIAALMALPADAATAVMEFSKIQYNSPGTDNRSNISLNAEYVRITNNGTVNANLQNWTLRDKAGHVFKFPSVTVKPGQRLYVHTGSGTDFKPDSQHLYWKSGNYIWNNTGDTATLRSASGRVYDTCSWRNGHRVTNCGFKAQAGLPANPGRPAVPVQQESPAAPSSTPSPSASTSASATHPVTGAPTLLPPLPDDSADPADN